VLHTYLPNIEDLYRASDLYLFPVHEGSGSIEFPLSVLEAMACNLPVLATRFGALPESFPEGFGLRYLAQGENVGDAVTGLFSEPPRTRELVAAYSWDAVLSDLMNRVTEAVKA
jgi:glycosyltransferase involved in cell wall biosynthesis